MLFFNYCKEEPVQPKEVKSTAEISAAKVANKAQLAVLLDDDKATKKEKFEKLKAEHEKPFVALKKPIDALKEYLITRKKSTDGYNSKGVNQKSIMQALCTPIYVEFWAFEKYQTVSGLETGIDPKENWGYDQNTLSELKNKYAFKKTIMPEVPASQNQVYARSNIILDFGDYHPSRVTIFCNSFTGSNYGGVYIDEPYHNNFGNISWKDSLSVSKNIWKTRMGSSFPVLSGETCIKYADEIDDIVDGVSMTAYTNMISNFLLECVQDITDSDQRSDWSDFNSSYGSKFNPLWINGGDDQGEMDQLIGHAQNMGKNQIWLWEGGGRNDEQYWAGISEFCNYAWTHGYLSRVDRKYFYEYVYIGYGDPVLIIMKSIGC